MSRTSLLSEALTRRELMRRGGLSLAAGMTMPRLLCASTGDGQETPSFDRFPVIGEYREPERTLPVITSDGVADVLRPTWTRAMTDLGGWPAMFRFLGDIYLAFYHGDGHRYQRLEATNRLKTFRSSDEGHTWNEVPSCPPNSPDKFQGTPEFLPVGDTLFCYDWNAKRQTQVRTSQDGETWSEPRNCYEPPFYFWGVMYDPESATFWCPPHAIPNKGTSDERQIHLIKSSNGIDWQLVSVVAPFNNASESTLRFEVDRTMVIVIRRKYARHCSVAVAKPPYKEWTITDRPVITEGHHFFDIGGQTFLASRSLYSGNDERVLANNKVFDGRKAYSTIYRWTPDRQLVEWAVMDSMGDCSYPFLIETPEDILCAYYSQHENGVCKAFLCAYDRERFLKQSG